MKKRLLSVLSALFLVLLVVGCGASRTNNLSEERAEKPATVTSSEAVTEKYTAENDIAAAESTVEKEDAPASSDHTVVSTSKEENKSENDNEDTAVSHTVVTEKEETISSAVVSVTETRNEPEKAQSEVSKPKDTAVTSSNETPSNNSEPVTNNSLISRTKAKSIALSHAGVKESNVRDLDIELDKEKNNVFYEISFEAGSYEYDYLINAKNGKVISHRKERNDDEPHSSVTSKPVTSEPQSSTETISKEKAKSIALNHAGVKTADVYDFEIELDREKGVPVYEIEFGTKTAEYTYEINAKTGKILHSEKEFDD